MTFPDEAPAHPYLERAMFYKYVLQDQSPYRQHEHPHYGLGTDIARVLEETDPWYLLFDVAHEYGLPELVDSYFDPIPRRPSAPPYPEPLAESTLAGDPLESILSGKRDSLARSALDILGLMYGRERLHREHMTRMDDESCTLGSRLLELERWPLGSHPGIDRMRGSLESESLSLERERRMQEVNTWRDISRLRADLRETLSELDLEARKRSLLYPKDEHTTYG